MFKDIKFLNLRIAKYNNQKRSMRFPLKRENKVYLLRKHIKIKWLSTKLDFKKLKLYKILKKNKAN